MKRFVTALVFVVATSVGAFAQNLPLPSKWQNQRNSTMELKLGKSPAAVNFTGLYCNRAEGFGCQCGNNVNRYKITGQANGSSVTFTVRDSVYTIRSYKDLVLSRGKIGTL
jgi:Avidin family